MLFSFSGQKISFYNACFVLQKKLAILSGKIFTTLKFCLFNNVLTYLFSLSNPNIPPLDLLFHIKFVFFFGTEHTKWFRHFVFRGTFVAAKCIYSNFCSQLHFVSFVAGTFTTYQTDTIREISTSFGNTIVALLTFGRNSSFFIYSGKRIICYFFTQTTETKFSEGFWRETRPALKSSTRIF